MTLTEFLLARFAEDEADYREEFYYGYLDVREQLLAGCEAKRAIVRRYQTSPQPDRYLDLCSLAAPYASHPDYNSEWSLS